MKSVSKLACLFGLWLLGGFCMIVSFNVTNGAWLEGGWIRINLWDFAGLSTAHTARLLKLYLWNGDDYDIYDSYISAWSDSVDIYNGLIVDSNAWIQKESSWELIVVWWWTWNYITSSRNSGIVWWGFNTIVWQLTENTKNAAIGGGYKNEVNWDGWIVAWGKSNTWYENWIVLWWMNNKSAGVVLWWQGNEAGENGLVMWQWAKWEKWSFVWNDGTYPELAADINSALVGTENWLLIWILTPKENVNLVVNWPISIWNLENENISPAGAIVSKDGCLYAYDGAEWHSFGTWVACNNSSYHKASTCKFGGVLLQEWNVVAYAYSMPYSSDCSSKLQLDVVCSEDWKMKKDGVEYKYPSCFDVVDNPYYNSES